jgi:hypothetical protein
MGHGMTMFGFFPVICDNLSENLREGTLTTTTSFILSTHLRNIHIHLVLLAALLLSVKEM